LREGRNFFIQGNFYEEFERHVKGPCKQAAFSIGALLGNLERVHLQGHLREKKKMHNWVPFSWTQRTLKVKSVDHLEL